MGCALGKQKGLQNHLSGVRFPGSLPINTVMITQFLNKIVAAVWWIYTLPRNYDQERRNSVKYKKKKEIVKNVWIVSGSVMCCAINIFPFMFAMGCLCVLGLTTTFLGFMILDETP